MTYFGQKVSFYPYREIGENAFSLRIFGDFNRFYLYLPTKTLYLMCVNKNTPNPRLEMGFKLDIVYLLTETLKPFQVTYTYILE